MPRLTCFLRHLERQNHENCTTDIAYLLPSICCAAVSDGGSSVNNCRQGMDCDVNSCSLDTNGGGRQPKAVHFNPHSRTVGSRRP